jgi:hypothetical protein
MRCQREASPPLNPKSGSNLGYEKQWLFEASFPSQSVHYSASTQENFMDAMAAPRSSSPPKFYYNKRSRPITGKEAIKEQEYLLKAKLPKEAVGTLGYAYECLVRKQFGFRTGIPSPSLIPDAGTNIEITLQGRKDKFSIGKLEQFKKYLQSPKGVLVLFVPSLHLDAEQQLIKIGQIEQIESNRKEVKKQIKIIVYETAKKD